MFKDWWHKFVWGETIEETKIRFDKIRKEEKEISKQIIEEKQSPEKISEDELKRKLIAKDDYFKAIEQAYHCKLVPDDVRINPDGILLWATNIDGKKKETAMDRAMKRNESKYINQPSKFPLPLPMLWLFGGFPK
jgi:hypothetical protein